jgi:hypothetical protein
MDMNHYFVIVDPATGMAVESNLTWPVAFRVAARNPGLAILAQHDGRLHYSYAEAQYCASNVVAGERPDKAPPSDASAVLERLTAAARALGVENLFLGGDLKEVLKELGGEVHKTVYREAIRGLFVIESVRLTMNGVELHGQWASRPATPEETCEFKEKEAAGGAHRGGAVYTAVSL